MPEIDDKNAKTAACGGFPREMYGIGEPLILGSDYEEAKARQPVVVLQPSPRENHCRQTLAGRLERACSPSSTDDKYRNWAL